MSIARRVITSLRLAFRWSSTTQGWQERLGDLTLVGGIVWALAIWSLFRLDWWQLALVWTVCLLPALAFSLKGWLKIFGPVLYYDMIRQARRTRFIAYRFLYALVLVLLLYAVWTSAASNSLSGTAIDRASSIAQNYFDVFVVAQFVVVGLLTPVYVAGAIAEEKEQKTLEFMLATDLLNREIVLSKLLSRLANLVLLVLTGLPIVSILQFLGGVDPNLVLAAFAVTGLTILSQAGVSILCSVYCKNSARAIAVAFLVMAAFYVAPTLFRSLLTPTLLRTTIWYGFSAGDLLNLFAMGNVGNFLEETKIAGGRGTLALVLPELVLNYAILHGAIALGCTTLAIAQLRKVAARQIGAKPVKARTDFWLWSRPRIGSNALLWKELHCGGSQLPPWAASIWMAAKLVGTVVPALFVVFGAWAYYDFGRQSWYEARNLNWWVSMANAVVGCLIILTIAARASTAISKERDKQTLNTLLTTPFSVSAILHAKWAGSMLSVRLGMVWLAVIWAVAIVSGAVRLDLILVIIPVWTIFAVFAAMLGLWYSTVSTSSLRATVMTMLVLVGLSVAPVAAGWVLGDKGPISRKYASVSETLAESPTANLSPPLVLFRLAYSSKAPNPVPQWAETNFALVVLFVCVVLWLLGSIILFQQTCGRFQRLANRGTRVPRSCEDWVALKGRHSGKARSTEKT